MMPEMSWGAVPTREPEIEASIRVGGRADNDGGCCWHRRNSLAPPHPMTLPTATGSGSGAREGALPAGYARHTITLSANYHITHDNDRRARPCHSPAPQPVHRDDGTSPDSTG